MIADRDRAFVWLCAESFMRLGPHRAPALDEIAEEGIPPDMWLDEPDEEGTVSWKVLPSQVPEEELERIEARMPGAFPPVFRAWMTTLYIPSLHFGEIRLPHVPSHAPLDQLQECVQRWSGLFDAGYAAFSEGEWGPCAFDLLRRDAEGDCPVVLFDREELLAVGRDQWVQRGLVEPCAQLHYASFRALLADVFLTRAAREPIAE